MHSYIGIVRTYIRSDGLSTRLDDQNILTSQSADTNESPRDPLLGHLKCNQMSGLGSIFQSEGINIGYWKY